MCYHPTADPEKNRSRNVGSVRKQAPSQTLEEFNGPGSDRRTHERPELLTQDIPGLGNDCV